MRRAFRPPAVRTSAVRSSRTWLFLISTLAAPLQARLVAQEPPAQDLVVETTAAGTVQGSMARGVRAFKGIPFAAPPVGELRWKPPQPVQPWGRGTLTATSFGPRCMQAPYAAGSVFARPPAPTSEDCLYLNVWTAADDTELHPVMLWIYGGALTRGSAAITIYDGAALARKGAVVVTFNYRLGPFGYLAHPELSAESEHGASGNYGVLDQVAALEWVRDNIERFGGDPQRVTIFGESAGSWSVNGLMATPLAAGLFHRAIGQSGASFGPMASLRSESGTEGSAEAGGVSFAEALGVETLSEMRALSAARILETAGGPGRSFRTGPNVDGWVFPTDINTAFASGRHNDVPVVVGFNADEMTSLTAPASVPRTLPAYREWVVDRVGADAERFEQVYPVPERRDIRDAYMRSRGDALFGIQMRTWARAVTAGGSDAYLYYFTHQPPGQLQQALKAYHASEIVYAFGNVGPNDREPGDRRLADAMSSYWVNFAASGNPNGTGLPEWYAYEIGTEPYMTFGDAPERGRGLRAEQLDFWDRRLKEGRP